MTKHTEAFNLLLHGFNPKDLLNKWLFNLFNLCFVWCLGAFGEYFWGVFGGVWEAFLWYAGRFSGGKHQGTCKTKHMIKITNFMNVVI